MNRANIVTWIIRKMGCFLLFCLCAFNKLWNWKKTHFSVSSFSVVGNVGVETITAIPPKKRSIAQNDRWLGWGDNNIRKNPETECHDLTIFTMVEDTWRNLILFLFFHIFNIFFFFLFDVVTLLGGRRWTTAVSKSVIDNNCDTNDWMNRGMADWSGMCFFYGITRVTQTESENTERKRVRE
jgi:hypothetical protein